MPQNFITLKRPPKNKEPIKIRPTEGPEITLIAAIAENGVIGSNNSIPWKLRNDMRRFKEYTMGKMVLMGFNTFDSLPALLKGRFTIVLSRDYKKVQEVVDRHKANGLIDVPPVYCMSSLEELRDSYRTIKTQFHDQYNVNELVVAGGTAVYDQFIDIADKVVLTIVKSTPSGDSFWPRDNLKEFTNKDSWRNIEERGFFKDEINEYDYKFLTYVRPQQAKIISIAGKCEVSKLDRLAAYEMVNKGK